MIADTECNAQYSQELVCSRHTAFTPTLHGTGCYVMPQDAQLPSAFFGVHLAQLRAIRTLASHHTISHHITSQWRLWAVLCCCCCWGADWWCERNVMVLNNYALTMHTYHWEMWWVLLTSHLTTWSRLMKNSSHLWRCTVQHPLCMHACYGRNGRIFEALKCRLMNGSLSCPCSSSYSTSIMVNLMWIG